MSDKIELNISESTLEQLRCSLCKGYLSCAPIRILPDGANICGRCSPPDDVPTYLQLTLEAIMQDATFPCKFIENGCKERISFESESTNNIHEMECVYRNGPQEETTTVVLHDAEITLKLGGDESEKAVSPPTVGSKIINPFNIRKNSNVSSILSVRDYNGFINSPRTSPRPNPWSSWNENAFNRNDRNNYNQRNGNPYYNSYRRRANNNNHRNDVVVIKGHTIYVTL